MVRDEISGVLKFLSYGKLRSLLVFSLLCRVSCETVHSRGEDVGSLERNTTYQGVPHYDLGVCLVAGDLSSISGSPTGGSLLEERSGEAS